MARPQHDRMVMCDANGELWIATDDDFDDINMDQNVRDWRVGNLDGDLLQHDWNELRAFPSDIAEPYGSSDLDIRLSPNDNSPLFESLQPSEHVEKMICSDCIARPNASRLFQSSSPDPKSSEERQCNGVAFEKTYLDVGTQCIEEISESSPTVSELTCPDPIGLDEKTSNAITELEDKTSDTVVVKKTYSDVGTQCKPTVEFDHEACGNHEPATRGTSMFDSISGITSAIISAPRRVINKLSSFSFKRSNANFGSLAQTYFGNDPRYIIDVHSDQFDDIYRQYDNDIGGTIETSRRASDLTPEHRQPAKSVPTHSGSDASTSNPSMESFYKKASHSVFTQCGLDPPKSKFSVPSFNAFSNHAPNRGTADRFLVLPCYWSIDCSDPTVSPSTLEKMTQIRREYPYGNVGEIGDESERNDVVSHTKTDDHFRSIYQECSRDPSSRQSRMSINANVQRTNHPVSQIDPALVLQKDIDTTYPGHTYQTTHSVPSGNSHSTYTDMRKTSTPTNVKRDLIQSTVTPRTPYTNAPPAPRNIFSQENLNSVQNYMLATSEHNTDVIHDHGQPTNDLILPFVGLERKVDSVFQRTIIENDKDHRPTASFPWDMQQTLTNMLTETNSCGNGPYKKSSRRNNLKEFSLDVTENREGLSNVVWRASPFPLDTIYEGHTGNETCSMNTTENVVSMKGNRKCDSSNLITDRKCNNVVHDDTNEHNTWKQVCSRVEFVTDSSGKEIYTKSERAVYDNNSPQNPVVRSNINNANAENIAKKLDTLYVKPCANQKNGNRDGVSADIEIRQNLKLNNHQSEPEIDNNTVTVINPTRDPSENQKYNQKETVSSYIGVDSDSRVAKVAQLVYKNDNHDDATNKVGKLTQRCNGGHVYTKNDECEHSKIGQTRSIPFVNRNWSQTNNKKENSQINTVSNKPDHKSSLDIDGKRYLDKSITESKKQTFSNGVPYARSGSLHVVLNKERGARWYITVDDTNTPGRPTAKAAQKSRAGTRSDSNSRSDSLGFSDGCPTDASISQYRSNELPSLDSVPSSKDETHRQRDNALQSSDRLPFTNYCTMDSRNIVAPFTDYAPPRDGISPQNQLPIPQSHSSLTTANGIRVNPKFPYGISNLPTNDDDAVSQNDTSRSYQSLPTKEKIPRSRNKYIPPYDISTTSSPIATSIINDPSRSRLNIATSSSNTIPTNILSDCFPMCKENNVQASYRGIDALRPAPTQNGLGAFRDDRDRTSCPKESKFVSRQNTCIYSNHLRPRQSQINSSFDYSSTFPRPLIPAKDFGNKVYSPIPENLAIQQYCSERDSHKIENGDSGKNTAVSSHEPSIMVQDRDNMIIDNLIESRQIVNNWNDERERNSPQGNNFNSKDNWIYNKQNQTANCDLEPRADSYKFPAAGCDLKRRPDCDLRDRCIMFKDMGHYRDRIETVEKASKNARTTDAVKASAYPQAEFRDDLPNKQRKSSRIHSTPGASQAVRDTAAVSNVDAMENETWNNYHEILMEETTRKEVVGDSTLSVDRLCQVNNTPTTYPYNMQNIKNPLDDYIFQSSDSDVEPTPIFGRRVDPNVPYTPATMIFSPFVSNSEASANRLSSLSSPTGSRWSCLSECAKNLETRANTESGHCNDIGLNKTVEARAVSTSTNDGNGPIEINSNVASDYVQYASNATRPFLMAGEQEQKSTFHKSTAKKWPFSSVTTVLSKIKDMMLNRIQNEIPLTLNHNGEGICGFKEMRDYYNNLSSKLNVIVDDADINDNHNGVFIDGINKYTSSSLDSEEYLEGPSDQVNFESQDRRNSVSPTVTPTSSNNGYPMNGIPRNGSGRDCNIVMSSNVDSTVGEDANNHNQDVCSEGSGDTGWFSWWDNYVQHLSERSRLKPTNLGKWKSLVDSIDNIIDNTAMFIKQHSRILMAVRDQCKVFEMANNKQQSAVNSSYDRECLNNVAFNSPSQDVTATSGVLDIMNNETIEKEIASSSDDVNLNDLTAFDSKRAEMTRILNDDSNLMDAERKFRLVPNNTWTFHKTAQFLREKIEKRCDISFIKNLCRMKRRGLARTTSYDHSLAWSDGCIPGEHLHRKEVPLSVLACTMSKGTLVRAKLRRLRAARQAIDNLGEQHYLNAAPFLHQ